MIFSYSKLSHNNFLNAILNWNLTNTIAANGSIHVTKTCLHITTGQFWLHNKRYNFGSNWHSNNASFRLLPLPSAQINPGHTTKDCIALFPFQSQIRYFYRLNDRLYIIYEKDHLYTVCNLHSGVVGIR